MSGLSLDILNHMLPSSIFALYEVAKNLDGEEEV